MHTHKTLWRTIGILWVSSLLALLLLFYLEKIFIHWGGTYPLLIGSFGASAVLFFGAPQSPFSRFRNVFWGHTLSALVGVSVYTVLGNHPMFAASLAVSTAIALMYATQTLHPPGGATAYIAVMGGASIHELGFMYVLMPCALGALLLCTFSYIAQRVTNK